MSADRIGDGSDSSDGIVRLREAPNQRVRRDTVSEIQGGFCSLPVASSLSAVRRQHVASQPVGVIYPVERACQINMVKKLGNSSKDLTLMFSLDICI